MRKSYAIILGFLAFAFCLRVLGQVLVAFGHVSFLPPMDEWYSGLLPYPVLLPIQILILAVQAKVSLDIWRGSGFFAIPRPRSGMALCVFSYVYFAAMVLRYVLTMSLYPERRWFGGTIPIFFHFVLAAYVFLLGRYQVQAIREPFVDQAASASART
ncbi:MAG: hypothetical protein WD648_05965 [Planctomycetaceae bacterium]